MANSKVADMTGPGIGNYTRFEKVLPNDYSSALTGGRRNEIPLSIGGGIGQARTMMLPLKKAHLSEMAVRVWPKVLKEIGAPKISTYWTNTKKSADAGNRSKC
jgi:hypothetical protein